MTTKTATPPHGDFQENDLEREVASVYRNHFRELLAYAVHLVRGPDIAQDAVQEAFLRYFVERRYGRSVDNPRAWLYRVVHNYLLDRQSSATAKREAPWEDAGAILDESPNPEAELAQAQAAEQLTSLLSGRELLCVRLRAEGFSYDEAAEIMGIRPGTVSALLTRAHKKLRMANGNCRGLRARTLEALYFLLRKEPPDSPRHRHADPLPECEAPV